MSTTTKQCTLCQGCLDLTSENFERKAATRDGFSPWCKSCSRAKKREAYQRDPAKHRERQRVLREVDGKGLNEKRRVRYHQPGVHRDRALERAAQYRKQHRDQIRESYDAWSQTSQGQLRRRLARTAYKHKRREAGTITRKMIESVMSQATLDDGCMVCEYCDRAIKDRDWHLEHRIPISRGGTNAIENLGVACPACNLEKGPKTPDEYREYLGVLAP